MRRKAVKSTAGVPLGKRSTLRGGLPQGWERPWGGLHVDAELRDEWLERLNSISGLKVDYTCAGHPDVRGDDRYPRVCVIFLEAPRMNESQRLSVVENVETAFDRKSIKSAGGAGLTWYGSKDADQMLCIASLIERDLMGDEQFSKWWEAVIGVLEGY